MRVTYLANKLNQKLIKMEITKEQILKIVDQCFHYYASSFRNEARQEATDLIEKHELAIFDTRCCKSDSELLSCGSCKGTDLRKKGDNYYVCNYCGNTMTT